MRVCSHVCIDRLGGEQHSLSTTMMASLYLCFSRLSRYHGTASHLHQSHTDSQLAEQVAQVQLSFRQILLRHTLHIEHTRHEIIDLSLMEDRQLFVVVRLRYSSLPSAERSRVEDTRGRTVSRSLLSADGRIFVTPRALQISLMAAWSACNKRGEDDISLANLVSHVDKRTWDHDLLDIIRRMLIAAPVHARCQ